MCGVLSSPIPEVQLAGLDCLAALTNGNETVAAALLKTSYMGKSLISQVSFATIISWRCVGGGGGIAE